MTEHGKDASQRAELRGTNRGDGNGSFQNERYQEYYNGRYCGSIRYIQTYALQKSLRIRSRC